MLLGAYIFGGVPLQYPILRSFRDGYNYRAYNNVSWDAGPPIELPAAISISATTHPATLSGYILRLECSPIQVTVTIYPAALYGAGIGAGSLVVLNAKTLAVTEWSLLPLDVVSHDGEVYFLTRTALTKLDPAEPLASASYVQTGDLALSDGHRINVWRAHMDLSADAPMRLTTRMKMAGQERDIAYTVPARSSTQERARMVELARGPRAERWAFKIGTTEAGGNWALGSLAVVPGANKRGR